MTCNSHRDSYKRVNLEESYPALFELLWYSQLPCFDVMNVTTKAKEEHGRHFIDKCSIQLVIWYAITGMIKECLWRGKRLSCSAIFSMHPTDRGMCCSFNKEKADLMFKNNRYQDQITKLTDQDKKMSFEDSALPDWYTHSRRR